MLTVTTACQHNSTACTCQSADRPQQSPPAVVSRKHARPANAAQPCDMLIHSSLLVMYRRCGIACISSMLRALCFSLSNRQCRSLCAGCCPAGAAVHLSAGAGSQLDSQPQRSAQRHQARKLADQPRCVMTLSTRTCATVETLQDPCCAVTLPRPNKVAAVFLVLATGLQLTAL